MTLLPPRDEDVKPYRSQAEAIRVWQGWVLIIIAGSSVITNILVALRVFGIL